MDNITIVDSHCHLDFPDFIGNQEEFVKRAEENSVKYMQTICTHMSKFGQVLEIAERFDNIFASVGVHPHEVKNEKVTAQELIEAASHKKIIAIGETGLDFFYEHSPRQEQEESFRIHIEAARELDLPIIIHTRDADDDTIRILNEEMKKGKFRGLIHCFSTSYDLAQKSMDMGLYISISGIVTFKKSTELQEMVRKIPLEMMLVETDSPFLAPVPFRGKVNEPSYTRYVAECVAELKGVELKEVADKTTANFFELFTKAQR